MCVHVARHADVSEGTGMTQVALQPNDVLTASQREVFDHLLQVGAHRPTAPTGIADELRRIISDGTSASMGSWTEPSLWMSKARLSTLLRCEGQTIAYAQSPSDTVRPSTLTGIVAHLAIQLSNTHPNYSARTYTDWALAASTTDEPALADLWERMNPAQQSDVINRATERVTSFLDSWPALDPRWEPRFDASIQAKVGRLTLAGRPDLVLGRPRPPRQTMFLCDFKSNGLHDGHMFEADFYALISTLRYGVPPYRSMVYSLSAGDWTEPTDVSADRLRVTATTVADATKAYVEIMTASRAPELTPGPQCRWCPQRASCPAALLEGDPQLVSAATKTSPAKLEAVATTDTPVDGTVAEPLADDEPVDNETATPTGEFGPFTLS